MKNICLVFCTLIISSVYGQTRIKFDYDSAGNQTKRYICINCNARMANIDTLRQNEKKALPKEDLKEVQNFEITYYPNPVTEELFIKWPSEKSDFISKIDICNMSGQSLKSYSGLSSKDNIILPFDSYAQGYYIIVLFYRDGSKQSINIIKK